MMIFDKMTLLLGLLQNDFTWHAKSQKIMGIG